MKRVVLRRIGLVVASLVLLLLVVSTVLRLHGERLVHKAVMEFEQSVGPVEFVAYQPEDVSDADNAALPVIEGLEWVKERARDEGWGREAGLLGRQNRRSAGEWNTEEWSRARSLVDSSQELAEILQGAVGRSGSSFGLDYEAGPFLEVPSLLEALRMGNLLFARTRIAWEDGESEEAVRTIEALGALGRSLEGEPLLIFQLIGNSVELLQFRAIQEGLAPREAGAVNGLDREDLRRLRASSEERARAERFREVVGFEGATTYLTRPRGPAEGGYVFTGSWLDRLASILVDYPRWLDRYRHEWLGYRSVAGGLRYYAEIAGSFSSRSYQEMLAEPGLLDVPAHDRRTLVIELDRIVGRLKAAEALAWICRTSLDVAIVQAETGVLPEELPAGVGDGHGPFTGNPVRYERLEDGTATLVLPGAEGLWKKVGWGVADDRPGGPLFTWRLVAPSSGGTV